MELTLGGIGLRAVSVGGLETCIEVPSWKLCFDIGRCPPTARNATRVLFTHGHIDHMGGVMTHCGMRDLNGMSPPEYWVPSEYYADFLELVEIWRRLDRADLPCTVREVAPGQRIQLRRDRSIGVFRAVHRVPTVGYCLLSHKERLKPAYRDLPGREIGRLRAAGEAISDTVETPELAFCGDTTIDVLEREAWVRTARVLILEVTFLDDRVSVERARKTGHVHLDEVIAHAELFQNEHILLTHFSVRYGPAQIEQILKERLPKSLAHRVTALLPEWPWVRRAD